MPEKKSKKQKDPRDKARDTQVKGKEKLPPIVRKVPDPPVPNRAHTEM